MRSSVMPAEQHDHPKWEKGHRNPLTPQGQIEQWGRLAHGARSNPQGRRTAVLMLVALGIAIAVLVLAAVAFAG